MIRLVALVTAFVSALLLGTAIAEPLHIVVTAENTSDDTEGEAGVILRRRIFLSNGQKLLNLTNDDENVMIDCESSESAEAIRRVIVLRRQPQSEDDVIGTRRSYDDEDGSTFSQWEKACLEIHKRRLSIVSKRKVFPEVNYSYIVSNVESGPSDYSISSRVFYIVHRTRPHSISDPQFFEHQQIVYPGTKWCGPGDDSEDYEDLGPLENTDKCCRAHDNCPVHILPFTTQYHYFNYRSAIKYTTTRIQQKPTNMRDFLQPIDNCTTLCS